MLAICASTVCTRQTQIQQFGNVTSTLDTFWSSFISVIKYFLTWTEQILQSKRGFTLIFITMFIFIEGSVLLACKKRGRLYHLFTRYKSHYSHFFLLKKYWCCPISIHFLHKWGYKLEWYFGATWRTNFKQSWKNSNALQLCQKMKLD